MCISLVGTQVNTMEESGDTFTSTPSTTEAIFSTSTVPCPITVVEKTQATIVIMSISLVLIILVAIKTFKVANDMKTTPKPYETFVSTMAAENGWGPTEIGDDTDTDVLEVKAIQKT